MVVAVGAPPTSLRGPYVLPPLKGHGAAAGKHARWCHVRPAHSWACFLCGERRAGVSCGPCLHLVPLS